MMIVASASLKIRRKLAQTTYSLLNRLVMAAAAVVVRAMVAAAAAAAPAAAAVAAVAAVVGGVRGGGGGGDDGSDGDECAGPTTPPLPSSGRGRFFLVDFSGNISRDTILYRILPGRKNWLSLKPPMA